MNFNQTNFKSLTGAALFTLLISIFMLSFESCKKEKADPLASPKYDQLNTAMQKLWSDHMYWTLSTVEAFFHNPDALNDNLTRLLQNQKDIGAAIVPYYGQAAGDTLAALLTEHIQLAVPVLTAAKNNDNTAVGAAVANWKKNAKDIADFLSAANPNNWPASVTESALEHHIDHTVEYSVDILNNNYTDANATFEHALEHMLGVATTLSEGIAKQFPSKF